VRTDEDQADYFVSYRPGECLHFYKDVLSFVKKGDFSQESYRCLRVASPDEPDGTELQLALSDSPAAKAYRQAMFQEGQPASSSSPRRVSRRWRLVRVFYRGTWTPRRRLRGCEIDR